MLLIVGAGRGSALAHRIGPSAIQVQPGGPDDGMAGAPVALSGQAVGSQTATTIGQSLHVSAGVSASGYPGVLIPFVASFVGGTSPEFT